MADIRDFKIFIDPGHGGNDPGANVPGYTEKEFALDIALHVRNRLNAYGAETEMSRETDVRVETEERSLRSNNFGANIFCSVHINAGGGTGLETWVHDNATARAVTLAGFVQNSMVSRLGEADRKVKRAPSQRPNQHNIHVIDPQFTNAWAVLPEVMFIDNSNDLSKLTSSTFRRNAGNAIADGIKNFVDSLPWN